MEAVERITSSVHQCPRWCFFCFKKCENAEPDKHDQLQQTYLGVLLRYIDSVELKDQLRRLNEFSNDKLSTCQDCSFVLSGLHKSYHEMKCAELRVKWRLETLLKVMTLAERVKLRVREFENNLRTSSTPERTDEVKDVYELRRKIKGKGKEKLRLSFPRLALKRCLNEQAKATNMDTVELDIKRLKTESPMSPKREEGEAQAETEIDPDFEFSEMFTAKQPDSEQESELSSGEIVVSEVDSVVSHSPPNEVEAELKPTMKSNSEFTGYCKENEHHSVDRNNCVSSSTHEQNKGENGQIGIEDKSTLITIKTEKPSSEKSKGARIKKIKVSRTKHSNTIGRSKSERLFKAALKIKRNSETKDKPAVSASFIVKYDGAFPTLKELALEQIGSQKFSCKVRCCPARRNMGTFFNRTDYLSHKRLHGEFKCNFCEMTKTYAPDLTRHELLNHGKCFKDKLMGCSRCEWKSGWRRLLTHHIETHLKLSPPTRQSCLICQFPFHGWNAKQEFLAHYKLHHDLSGFDYSSINKCDVSMNCKAYFRTNKALRRHKVLKHGLRCAPLVSCILCAKKFPSKAEYRNHRITEHKIKFDFKCSVEGCDRAFPTKREVRSHERTHKRGNNICIQCGEKKTKGLVGHSKKHASEKTFPIISILSKSAEKFGLAPIDCEKYSCDKCPKVLYTKRDLETHVKLHGEFKCSFCEKIVTYAPDLLTHEMNHSASVSKPHKCPRCSVCRAEMTDLVDHFVESHLTLKMDWQSCSICDWTFQKFMVSKRGLWEHVLWHYVRVHNVSAVSSIESVYKCEEQECRAYFINEALFIAHQNSHKLEGKYKIDFTTNGVKIFVCRDCQRKYKTFSAMRHHWRYVHFKRGYLKCPEKNCYSTFATEEELNKHLETVEIVVCGKCGESFHGEAGLRRHENAFHNSEGNSENALSKTHRQCEQCGKLVSRTVFSTHMLWHAGPDAWEFECSVCSKKCVNEGKLKEHMRTHSGLKPFVCETCGAKYAHRHNLRNHVNSKHGDVTRMEPLPMGPKPNTPSARKGKKFKEKSSTKTRKKRGNAGRNEKAKGKVGLALEVEPDAMERRKSTRVTRKRVAFRVDSSDEG